MLLRYCFITRKNISDLICPSSVPSKSKNRTKRQDPGYRRRIKKECSRANQAASGANESASRALEAASWANDAVSGTNEAASKEYEVSLKAYEADSNSNCGSL